MAPRQMEPIHYYYGNELGITAAVHPANALACPVRPYLKGEHYACKGPIGPYRKARIMQLLEDLHFHKSLISDTALNSVAPIARICSLIVKAGFCSKHKAETCKTVSETQFDQIYTKALECAIFQHPDTGKGDLDFEGVTQILQASNARTPSRCEAKHAREEKGNDLVQPSAPKKRCLDGGGLHKSCVLSSNESVGEGIVWPPSDEPLWANLPSDDSLWPNLPWPLVTDALGQPSLDTNKASSLQGDALEGNTIHQANDLKTPNDKWWLTPLPLQSDDTSKQSLPPKEGAQPAVIMTTGRTSSCVQTLARTTARAGEPSLSVRNNPNTVNSLQGGDALAGNNAHQASGAITFDNTVFDNTVFGNAIFDNTIFDNFIRDDMLLPSLQSGDTLEQHHSVPDGVQPSAMMTGPATPSAGPGGASRSEVTSVLNSSAGSTSPPSPSSSHTTTSDVLWYTHPECADALLEELFPQ
ncbi:uncharacterized protein MYCGRDRAFT_97868 [Zymoseptoria tritici IPO323]|uniref:Uncharacterized protein n=1 Tax=Zymoseptoria tritici (strain CBS 115943 / IPO323) TaxID=336722 RepID=F9XRM3_ZYMTI|nr:uncharacterized protein MYCGRDRAFT_97868 [Zymoseptoria tritici IPO323]EGP82059.1 hypothetical protein MYCGRDRAFT_97868 [Zymoseptoria tritici IPO323]